MLAFVLAAACDPSAGPGEAARPAPAEATTPAASTDDRAVLEALYHAADGPNWTNSRNWLSEAPLGTWNGVTTDRSGRVMELRLRGNALRGEIPPELSRLGSLEVLELPENELQGAIPGELSDLANLTYLGMV